MFFMKKKEKALIEINGIFEGTINFNGKVVIADAGCCRIDITCKELDIYGRLEGSVDVGILTIYDSGVYSGSAKYRELKTMPGARIKYDGQNNDKEKVLCTEAEILKTPVKEIEKVEISFKSSF